MKIACLSFTDDGKKLGDKLVKYRYEPNKDKSCIVHHFENSKITGGIKGNLSYIVEEYDGIIFISAAGIAVRMMKSYIKDKKTDPAVIVIDDLGKFSISLLSGHIGGANELAKWTAAIIGAMPIITTASDGRGIEAIDNFAAGNGYEIECMEDVKTIMAMMVNGKRIGFYSEMEAIIDYKNIAALKSLEDSEDIQGIIAVTSREIVSIDIPGVVLRPKNINIGIGCRKDAEGYKIIEAIKADLEENNLSEKSIKAIGTIEAKKDEAGIIKAANYFNCPLKIFTAEEIRKVEDRFEKSDFVKEAVGVYSVSEPCAYLLGGDMRTHKVKHDGITISIAVEVYDG
ncbi:cobalt-precorrin 5A hydrolase [Lutispora saccharofermentans]|uniref:Cobalt-precorrin 5A hydrolase n=1 Tax=Lutispora saccharofermentans TaxID=3024236 RepID=A0ABT1NES7_9FIRM|nr:cobalt-precorrin 5A hydrolase [Lutispora saccharofermentans]MCQ1528346.1 cobalt-precorrin 5A hydrolase [Lutispora saccharofermentans]